MKQKILNFISGGLLIIFIAVQIIRSPGSLSNIIDLLYYSIYLITAILLFCKVRNFLLPAFVCGLTVIKLVETVQGIILGNMILYHLANIVLHGIWGFFAFVMSEEYGNQEDKNQLRDFCSKCFYLPAVLLVGINVLFLVINSLEYVWKGFESHSSIGIMPFVILFLKGGIIFTMLLWLKDFCPVPVKVAAPLTYTVPGGSTRKTVLPPAMPASTDSREELIQNYKDQLDRAVLTKEEYDKIVKQILDL